MPRLFLIRHGEPVTAWGGADPDPGLSDLGRREAEQASAILATKGGLEVISSPMRRCRETAEPYAASVGMTPVTEVGVSEIATPPGVQDRRAWLGENFPWQSPTGRRIWPDLDPAVRQWRDRVLQTVRAAAEAGVSKMTIYSNFGSKEGLFEAMVQDRTERVMGGSAGVEALDPMQPHKALLAIGEQFLVLTREEHTLGKFRSLYGAAGSQPEACQGFYWQGPERLIGELAAYLRRANDAVSLKVKNPRLAADLFLAMFLGDGHMRGLLMLAMPEARENKALLREAVRVFMAAYGVAA